MASERSRTTAKAQPFSGGLVRRSLLIFERARTRAVDLPAEGVLVVGRGDDADIELEDTSVSRRQIELAVGADRVLARDLGSSNGTFLDEEPLVDPRPLRPGAVLRAGATLLVLGEAQAGGGRACLSNLEIEGRVATRLEAARSKGEGLAVFLVRAPGPREVVAPAIRGLLGGDVLIGDYATGHYQAAVGSGPGGRGADLARELSAALRSNGVAAAVACSVFPDDGGSPDELLAGCLAALGTRPSRPAPPEPVVADPAMRRVFELARRVASGRIPVLIQGETGSGKEILAEHVQRCSPRAKKPFVRVNCAALPEPLLEAELFGYEKGAFTGAQRAKPGLFEAADGGTLLLDEVGELPAGQQAKLLRALEDGTVRRLGSLKDARVDVRVIAATNRNLEDACARGSFRSDLYFRLSGAIVSVPPLRERPRDLVAMARRFLSESAAGRVTLGPAAEDALRRHVWPGNVRELRNAMERAALLVGEGAVGLEHLPDRVRLSAAGAALGSLPGVLGAKATDQSWDAVRGEVREMERARIAEALESCDGNQTRAARKLGMPRRTFVAKLASLGLSRPRSPRT